MYCLSIPRHQAPVRFAFGNGCALVSCRRCRKPYVNPEHTVQVMDGPDFPDMFKPLAAAQGKALEELRTRNDIKWTFISPAGDFQADGARTGKYILGGEELVLNSKGESVISYADYAIAMVDELVKGDHIQQRISVVAE